MPPVIDCAHSGDVHSKESKIRLMRVWRNVPRPDRLSMDMFGLVVCVGMNPSGMEKRK
jgi:hypothetical protein